VAENERQFEADRDNLAKGGVLEGTLFTMVLQGPQAAMKLLKGATPLKVARMAGPEYEESVMVQDGVLIRTFELNRLEAAPDIEEGMRRMMLEKAASEPIGVNDLMPVSAAISALAAKRPPRSLMEQITEISSNKNLSSLQIADAIARVLKEAGVYEGNLAVVIDARSGSYDFAAVEEAMSKVASKDSPVRYFIITDTGMKSANSEVHIINIEKGAGANVMDAVRGAIDSVSGQYKVKIDNWNIAYAFPEEHIGLVEEHYRTVSDASDIRTMSNFLVTGKGAFKNPQEHTEVPGATVMMELAARLASQDQPTAMAVRCAGDTVKKLQGLLGGILRVIEKLNIGEIFQDFIRSMKSAAKSV